MGHGDSPEYSSNHRDSPDYHDRDRKHRRHVRNRSRSRSRSRDRNQHHRNHQRKRQSSSSRSRSRSRSISRSPSPPKYREKRDRRGLGYEGKEKKWDFDKYRDEIEDNRGRQNNDRWKDKDEAWQQQQDKFMEKRRNERCKIATTGVMDVWSGSPIRTEVDSDEFSEKEEKNGKSDASSSTDSEEERKRRRKKKKAKARKRKERKKKKSKKSKKKRRKSSSSDDSSSDSSDSDEEEQWVEVTKRDDQDAVVGPQLPMSLSERSGPLDYGRALLPGEGAAMAAFVADGKRIPRRGEIGLTSGEISTFEDAGYVMSGSRHRRMEAVRIRKENQIYSADEKRALASFNKEERTTREGKILRDFRELVHKKTRQEKK
ncbi:uncharacterized protein [Amphiura filiformis]|uniref:uncharacterized protein n=1 Tax=Amphiura filiformis TaxID=82378 RepID=UPI003B20EA2E